MFFVVGYATAVTYDGPIAKQHLMGFACSANGYDSIRMNDGSAHCAEIILHNHSDFYLEELITQLQAGINRNAEGME